MFRTVVLLALAVRGALSAYSVHYISGAAGPQVVLPSAGAVAQRLEAAPLPAEVADVYARLGGLPPLLNEGTWPAYIHLRVYVRPILFFLICILFARCVHLRHSPCEDARSGRHRGPRGEARAGPRRWRRPP